jgi:hypothetical protein
MWLGDAPSNGESEMRVDPESRHLARTIASRGYHAVYRPQESNHCPGCGRSHWHVGRISAECGFCATALPFASTCGRAA